MKKTIEIDVPEGYEHDGNEPFGSIFPTHVVVKFKKKEVKDFDWYVDHYSYLTGRPAISILKNRDFESVRFEDKIGLLKFICDDKRIGFNYFILNKACDLFSTRLVLDVCPKRFIDSIFK